jgi:hypothetical protein
MSVRQEQEQEGACVGESDEEQRAQIPCSRRSAFTALTFCAALIEFLVRGAAHETRLGECVCVSKKTDKTSFCSLAALLINCTDRSQQEQNLFAFVVLVSQCPNLHF